MKTGIIFSIIICITLVSGCVYSKSDDLFSTTINTCDTSNVKYSVDIVGILQTSCYRCHDVNNYATKGGNYRYDIYQPELKAMATNGKLYKAVAHLPGAVPMPFDGGMISDCSIAKIRAWVNKGAPNN